MMTQSLAFLLALAMVGGGLCILGFTNGCIYAIAVVLGGAKAVEAARPFVVQGVVYGAVGLALLVTALRLPLPPVEPQAQAR